MEQYYKYRHIASVVIEMQTPLAIGSGQKDLLTDSLVMTDVNGLPYLPGTTIAGIARAACQDSKQSNLWGDKGHGSEIIFSEGRVLNSKGEVTDDLLTEEEIDNDPLLHSYKHGQIIRQHVRINEYGTSENHGKFDQQVVMAGSRFCFEIELLATSEDKTQMDKIVSVLSRKSFRIGGGSRKGFGQIQVVGIEIKSYDLSLNEQLEAYNKRGSKLHVPTGKECGCVDEVPYHTYCMELKPKDFFLFGTGFGDNQGDADITSVTEDRVRWEASAGKIVKDCILIPAASIKGALRHRLAYHYNRLKECYVDNEEETDRPGNTVDNEAVKALFGDDKTPGKVLFSDVLQEVDPLDVYPRKLVNHVSIDAFTGGSIESALFTEQVNDTPQYTYRIEILMPKSLDTVNPICQAWEMTLKDVCRGMLPLGNGVNRGNGIFIGNLYKDDSLIYGNR